MPRMMPTELRALLTAERWDAMSAITASKLSEERSTALDYYQGDMSKTCRRRTAAPMRCATTSPTRSKG